MNIYILFLGSLFSILLLKYSFQNRKEFSNSENNRLFNSKYYDNSNQKDYIYTIFILIIFLFSAIRYNVGWDFMGYYRTITTDVYTNIGNNGEWLTILLINFAKALDLPQLYFIINSGVCIFFISSAVKKYSKNPWMSMILFVTFPLFYLNSFSVIRNFSAIAIVFYANRFILEKKLFKYIFAIIIASQFHKSALIGIVFYPLNNIKLTNLRLIFLLLMTPIISQIMKISVLLFTPQYSIYLNKTTKQEGTKAILVMLFLGLIITLVKKYIKIKNAAEIVLTFYNNFIYGLLIYVMFFETGTMGHRLSLYGTICSIILIPEIIDLFKSKKERLMLKVIVYLFFSIFFFYIIKAGSSTYIPYKIFINQ